MTYTYYEQLNGYEHLKSLDIGYFFYTGPYLDAIMKVLDPALKTIVHIPNVNARESTKDKIKEANEIMDALGDWQGEDPATGFHLVKRPDGRILKVADLVDDDAGQARQGHRRVERPGAEEQSRPRRHHHRARHGEGRLRLDLVRARADGRLSREPDRDHPDHRPRHARRAGQDGRPLHQSDRRTGRFGRRGEGCGQRHAEGDRRQPAHGTGAGAPLQVHAEGPQAPRKASTMARAATREDKANIGFNEKTGEYPCRDQGPRHAAEPGSHAHLQRGPERGDRQLTCRTSRRWSAACSTRKRRPRS